MTASITHDQDKIVVAGSPTPADLPYFSAVLNAVASKKGYRDITLDFKKTELVFQSFMVPLIALVRRYKGRGIDFYVEEPSADKTRALFYNANWSHYLDPMRYEHTVFEGTQHIPASVFKNHQEQYELAEKILEVILKSLSVDRKSLAAFEWAINEVMDNVLNHANSPFGGVVQATTFSNNVVEFVVADAGIGIPKSLGVKDDKRALEKAVQEGVTRNSKTNAGNGLFGTFEMARASSGSFLLQSQRAFLNLKEGDALKLGSTSSYFPGTIVVVRINCSQPDLISSALKFDGKVHIPAYDYVDRHLEEPSGAIRIRMKSETVSFGSRAAGKPILNKILNLISDTEVRKIVIDFEDVYVVSSSFADEVFGRLFAQLGPMKFINSIAFENVDPIVSGLVDRAIVQRSNST